MLCCLVLLCSLQDALGLNLTGWVDHRPSEHYLPPLPFDEYILDHRSCLRPGPEEMQSLLNRYLRTKLTPVAWGVTLLDMFPFPQFLQECEQPAARRWTVLSRASCGHTSVHACSSKHACSALPAASTGGAHLTLLVQRE